MEQKRNAYALSVWRRIRMKLEGTFNDVYSYRVFESLFQSKQFADNNNVFFFFFFHLF